MARVTVEDCIEKVSSRFDLVVKASQRARQIAVGAPLTIERDNDKNPVVALREIADGTVDLQELEEATLMSFRRRFTKAELGEVDDDEASAPELTLSGDIDRTEASLEAEFKKFETNAGASTSPEAPDTPQE